jgi:DNA-binding NtrC family response regulator
MEVFSRENDKQVTRLSREAVDLLVGYAWPGNVRELENAIERAIVLCSGDTVTADLLPDDVRYARRRPRAVAVSDPRQVLEPLIAQMRQTQSGGLYDAVVQAAERAVISHVLAANNGVQTRTARELGVSRNTLRDRIRTYGLAWPSGN